MHLKNPYAVWKCLLQQKSMKSQQAVIAKKRSVKTSQQKNVFAAKFTPFVSKLPPPPRLIKRKEKKMTTPLKASTQWHHHNAMM